MPKLNKTTKIFVLLDDKKRHQYVKTYYDYDKSLFLKENNEWWWVYFAVNDFDATEDQMKKDNRKTKRNIPYLKKLNAVFADLDVAKSWWWIDREDKQIRKNDLFQAVISYCEPTYIIDTSNWLQPLWALDCDSIDEDTQSRYVNIINWIIERSKKHWWAWDEVKDVARILRLPWYNHMKEEPYPITKMYESNKRYTIEMLEEKFLQFCSKKKETQVRKDYDTTLYDKTYQFREIDRLDFKEVVVRAFWSVWRNCEFDKDDRITLDWRLTWWFIWKNWDRRYLATTSHEPFKWNIITAVADIQWSNNKEAYKRLLETFNIRSESELRSKYDVIIKKEEIKSSVKKNFTHITYEEKIKKSVDELLSTDPDKIIKRWRDEWDDSLWGIYWWKIYLVWGNTWYWKSTFINQVCKNVWAAWNRVVKYSLEDRMEDIGKEELYYMCNRNRIQNWKQPYKRVSFLNNEYKTQEFISDVRDAAAELSKQNIVELEKTKQANIDEIVGLMEEECDNWAKLFCIDHLHYFEFDSWKERLDIQIQNTMHKINEVARKRNVAVILVAHYKNHRSNSYWEEPNYDDFKDAAALKQVANVIIQIERWSPDENEDDAKKSKLSTFWITKLRWPRENEWKWYFTCKFDVKKFEYSFQKSDEQIKKEQKVSRVKS